MSDQTLAVLSILTGLIAVACLAAMVLEEMLSESGVKIAVVA